VEETSTAAELERRAAGRREALEERGRVDAEPDVVLTPDMVEPQVRDRLETCHAQEYRGPLWEDSL
jgi:hypothetical protein